MTELISALLGAIVGGAITFIGESVYRKCEEKSNQRHSASILYNDLKSIQTYLLRMPQEDVFNIRYTLEWQRYVANCVFLKSHEIALIYEIYDMVYDYTQVFGVSYFDVEELPQDQMFKKISEKINHQNFKELMDTLKIKSEKK